MANFELDTSFALNIFAVIFFLVSVLYFSYEVVFQLSPVTKSILLLSMSSILILSGIMFSSSIWSALAYITGFISYIVSLIYIIGKFRPGQAVILGTLLGSALLFSLLGRSVSKGKIELGFRKFKITAACILVLSGAVTAFDLVGNEVEYETQFKDSIEVKEGENKIGTLTVRNNFPLPRDYENPDYEACRFDDGRERLHLDVGTYDTDSGMIDGAGTKKFDINYTARRMIVNEDENRERRLEISGEYSVEFTESCPGNPEDRTIYVFEEEDERVLD